MIELLYKAIFFKQRYETSRTDHAEFRMDPPDQSLRACQHRRIWSYIKLRLVVHLKLFLPQSNRESFYQLLGIKLLLMKAVIIHAYRFVK